jgi:hypothetical protein
VIRVYDEAGSVIETHEQVGDFKEALQGWELAGVAVDTSRSDKYVGFLKRKKQ